jgi:hypothetical protein
VTVIQLYVFVSTAAHKKLDGTWIFPFDLAVIQLHVFVSTVLSSHKKLDGTWIFLFLYSSVLIHPSLLKKEDV